MTFTSSAAGAAGSKRMKEIAAENQAEVKELIAKLLGGLGRPVTGTDEILAEVLASALVRSRRKRERGQDDRLERQQVASMLHNFPSLRAEPRTEQATEHHA
jgi:hypothetical protein